MKDIKDEKIKIEKKLNSNEKITMFELICGCIAIAMTKLNDIVDKEYKKLDVPSNYVIGIGTMLKVYKNITFDTAHSILKDIIKNDPCLGSLNSSYGYYGYYVGRYNCLESNSGYVTACIIKVGDIIENMKVGD